MRSFTDSAPTPARRLGGGKLFLHQEVATLLGLTRRQKDNIRSLLSLPDALRDALADEVPGFTATHALTIRAVLRQGQSLDLPAWIERVSLEGLSVRQLRRQLRAHTRPSADEPALGLIAQEGSAGAQSEVIYLRPRRIDLQALRPVDRACLVRDCHRLLERLGAALAGMAATGEGAAT